MQGTPAAAVGAVTVVTTAQQFKSAVVRGDEHIELQAHLDMSTVDPVDFRILGILPETVKSIRVRTRTHLPAICLQCVAQSAKRCAPLLHERDPPSASASISWHQKPVLQKHSAPDFRHLMHPGPSTAAVNRS